MATVYWTGKALAVAQVSSVQVGAYDAATTYSLTVNGVSVTSLAAGGAEAVASALVAAWNASTHPYFSPVTAALDTSVSPSDTVTLTADEAGFPFTVTSSVSGGSGAIGAVSTTTTATGPYHLRAGDNWSSGSFPADSDNAVIAKDGARICWDLDQSGASPTESFASLRVVGDVRIGLSVHAVATSADGETVSTVAPEYRATYMKYAITTVEIQGSEGVGTASGTGRCKIDNIATAASTTTVSATASSSADSTLPAVRLLFSSANADLYVNSARAGVGIAIEAGNETSTVGDIIVADQSAVSLLRVGSGVTHSTYSQNGGTAYLDAAATMPSVKVNGGVLYVQGTQAVTALTVTDGSVISNTTGTITTLTQSGGTVDMHRSSRARTVTTWAFNEGARLIDTGYTTITNDNRSGRITESVSK